MALLYDIPQVLPVYAFILIEVLPVPVGYFSYDFTRITRCYHIVGNVTCHYAPCPDDRVLSDSHSGNDNNAGAYPDVFTYINVPVILKSA